MNTFELFINIRRTKIQYFITYSILNSLRRIYKSVCIVWWFSLHVSVCAIYQMAITLYLNTIRQLHFFENTIMRIITIIKLTIQKNTIK